MMVLLASISKLWLEEVNSLQGVMTRMGGLGLGDLFVGDISQQHHNKNLLEDKRVHK